MGPMQRLVRADFILVFEYCTTLLTIESLRVTFNSTNQKANGWSFVGARLRLAIVSRNCRTKGCPRSRAGTVVISSTL